MSKKQFYFPPETKKGKVKDPEGLKKVLDAQAGNAPILKKRAPEQPSGPNPKEVRDAFEKWMQDLSHIDDYAMWNIKGPQCIIRVFKYEPPEDLQLSSTLTDVDGKPLRKQKDSKVVPLAKVLVAGSDSKYTTGQIVAIPQHLAKVKYNPAFLDWKDTEGERPKKKTTQNGEIPPMFMEGISDWIDYLFEGDPFQEKRTVEDRYTFLVPDGLLLGSYKLPDGYSIDNVEN